MKIAIDLNDVVRDYSNNFVKYYIEGYDHKFDLTDFEFWSHKMSEVFPFKNEKSSAADVSIRESSNSSRIYLGVW